MNNTYLAVRLVLLITLIVIGGLAALTGFCFALVDWVQDIKTGVYQENHVEAVLETSALFFYTYLATRFTKKKISL